MLTLMTSHALFIWIRDFPDHALSIGNKSWVDSDHRNIIFQPIQDSLQILGPFCKTEVCRRTQSEVISLLTHADESAFRMEQSGVEPVHIQRATTEPHPLRYYPLKICKLGDLQKHHRT